MKCTPEPTQFAQLNILAAEIENCNFRKADTTITCTRTRTRTRTRSVAESTLGGAMIRQTRNGW
jgi:hypothetical protein